MVAKQSEVGGWRELLEKMKVGVDKLTKNNHVKRPRGKLVTKILCVQLGLRCINIFTPKVFFFFSKMAVVWILMCPHMLS